MGGTFSYEGSMISGTLEFNSEAPQQVGEHFSLPIKLNGDQLTVTYDDGRSEKWTRVDNASDNLAGVWRITRRKNDGKMNEIPLRARRTLKIRSEEHTSELQSLMRISYAVFCWTKKDQKK